MSNNISSNLIKGVRHLVINRADARNALNQETIRELTKAIEFADADSETKVVLIYGAGESAFCSGADLKELAASNALHERHAFFAAIGSLLETIYRSSKPVICKVHGWALAGGMGIIAASDVVFASDDAKFGLPEVEVGLIPMVVQKALERVMSPRILSYLALSGDTLDAGTAMNSGLVSKVFSKSSLNSETNVFCEKLAEKPAHHLRAICESIRAKSSHGLFAELRDAAFKIAAFSLTSDSQNAVKGFLERKKPGKHN